MEVRKILNKNKKPMTTKDGEKLVEYRFEVGDEFIPLYNNVLDRTREVEVKGKKQTIHNYSIKCQVKTKDNVPYDEVFVTLTPAQATSLKKKAEEGLELNQNLFVAYAYESEEYGTQIGLGLKRGNKKAKTFEDFEKEE